MDANNFPTQDFSHICRTCLQTESVLTSLFDSKAADMLNYCDFCVISENDGFPNQICFTCIQILEQCYKFKQQCENSVSVLRKLLSTHEEADDHLPCLEDSSYTTELKHNIFTNEANNENSVDSNDLRNFALVTKSEEFSCRNCNKKFSDLQDLNQHSQSEECSKIIKTDLDTSEQIINLQEGLDNNFSANEETKENSEEINDDLISFLDKPLPPPLPYRCQNCDQSFSEENDLKIHQSVHSDKLVCLACSKKFNNRQILKRHLKIHLIKKPHVCKICSKSFPESYALTKHLRRHSGLPREKKHFCSECGQGFSEPYYLKVHLRKHTGERPLLCSVCHKTFADPRSLKIHIMIHSGEKPHKCNFCLKSFIQRANLTKHLRIHTGEKPYMCKVCGKKFSQSSSLDKHHRTHTGEKLYSCDKCDKRFAEKSTLNNHAKIHTADKPYVCKQCFSSFENKSALLLHYKQHGGAKIKNICRVCGKRLATHASLQEHLNTHAEEKPHECGICFRKFIHKSSLNKHSKIHEKGFHDENNTFINCSQFEQPSEDPLDLDADNNLYTENTFL